MFSSHGSIQKQIHDLQKKKSNLSPNTFLLKNRLQSKIDDLVRQLPPIQSIHITDEEDEIPHEEWSKPEYASVLSRPTRQSEADILIEIRQVENDLHLKRSQMQSPTNQIQASMEELDHLNSKFTALTISRVESSQNFFFLNCFHLKKLRILLSLLLT
jgi:chromosome segregation ATPase